MVLNIYLGEKLVKTIFTKGRIVVTNEKIVIKLPMYGQDATGETIILTPETRVEFELR